MLQYSKNLIAVSDLSNDDIDNILEKARHFQRCVTMGQSLDCLHSKIMASLFFEPSTRTRLSFESAMLRLGGQISTMEGRFSSAQKGESLADMGRIVSQYVDLIVMRHPQPHSVAEFAQYATVPVINAGDGPNQHPTQALLDLYTIYSEKQTLAGLKVGFVGDLKYGRTVHSLTRLLQRYDIELSFISTPQLRMPQPLLTELQGHSVIVQELGKLEDIIGDLDVLYVTRVQQERFDSAQDYEQVCSAYQINPAMLAKASDDLTVLHPLPRLDEIDPAIDSDPRACYFKQAANGVYARMALMDIMMRG